MENLLKRHIFELLAEEVLNRKGVVFYVELSEKPQEFDILRRQENEAIALD